MSEGGRGSLENTAFVARTHGEPIRMGGPDDDPIQDVVDYAKNHWVQQKCTIVTRCFRCRRDSEPVQVPFGCFAFGNPRLMRRGDVDITDDAILAFGRIGWKFQKHKSYCPGCKGLGSV